MQFQNIKAKPLHWLLSAYINSLINSRIQRIKFWLFELNLKLNVSKNETNYKDIHIYMNSYKVIHMKSYIHDIFFINDVSLIPIDTTLNCPKIGTVKS